MLAEYFIIVTLSMIAKYSVAALVHTSRKQEFNSSIFFILGIQWNLSSKAMREFGCFQSLFFIVVDHCVPFTLAVVKSQVVLQSPFVERFHCNHNTLASRKSVIQTLQLS